MVRLKLEIGGLNDFVLFGSEKNVVDQGKIREFYFPIWLGTLFYKFNYVGGPPDPPLGYNERRWHLWGHRKCKF
jgi:hypothetical protein